MTTTARTALAPRASSSVPTTQGVARPRDPIAWIELTCLQCGAVAGYVENGRLVRPNYVGGIRMVRRRLRCGRCDGPLLAGDRGIATAPGQIG